MSQSMNSCIDFISSFSMRHYSIASRAGMGLSDVNKVNHKKLPGQYDINKNFVIVIQRQRFFNPSNTARNSRITISDMIFESSYFLIFTRE